MRDKFNVNFRSFDSDYSCAIAQFDSLEEAVSLALALHRSSNIPHTIVVVSEAHCQTELTLKLFKDA